MERAEQEKIANVIRAEGDSKAAELISMALSEHGTGLIELRKIEVRPRTGAQKLLFWTAVLNCYCCLELLLLAMASRLRGYGWSRGLTSRCAGCQGHCRHHVKVAQRSVLARRSRQGHALQHAGLSMTKSWICLECLGWGAVLLCIEAAEVLDIMARLLVLNWKRQARWT